MIPEDENLQNGNEDDEKKTLFSFMQETIKQKPISAKRVVFRFLIMAGCGLLFGLFACLSFFALKPWAEHLFQEETEQVVLPEDLNEPQEPDTTSPPQMNSEDQQQAETQQPEEPDSQQTETEEPEPFVFTEEHYQQLINILSGISQEANKSIVFIQPTNQDVWITGENAPAAATGLLAADNGRELLILCNSSICDNATDWIATFVDNHQYHLSLKRQDKTRGLAVFALEKSSIEAETWSAVKIAVLGNSYRAAQGDFVIALGNMMGYGNLSSKGHTRIFTDAKCSVLTTDIAIMPGTDGFLFNQNGEVLGIIRADAWEGSPGNVANALAISELKPVLTLLLNGDAIPYVGLFGVTVTEEISLQQEIPMGLYVTEIAENSPAMASGIQNGDILQSVGGTDISSIDSFEKAVLACETEQTVIIYGKRRGAEGYVDIEFTVTVGSMQ